MNAKRTQNEIFERFGIPIVYTSTGPQITRGPNVKYPRVMLHDGVAGSGAPLILADGSVDGLVADEIARFNVWCFQPSYLWTSQRYALEEVRARASRMGGSIQFLAHFLAKVFWPSSDLQGYQGRIANLIGDDVWHYADGSRSDWPNLTIERVRAGLVDIWVEVLRSGLFDGCFVDPIAAGCGWMLAERPIDWSRCGFTSIDDWDRAMVAAHGRIVADLRERCPKAIIVGNGGPRGEYSEGRLANGWWRENFPNQNPGTWDANIAGPIGLISDSSYYAKPGFNVLSIASEMGPSTPWELRRILFGLGSSCLADVAFVLGPGSFNWRVPYRSWWLREYGVNRSTGGREIFANGWLGRSVNAATKIGAVWFREFAFGAVMVNPSRLSASIATAAPWARLIDGSVADYFMLEPESAVFVGRP